ncbi:MAG: hypothetical protein SGI98_10495 [Verrucomicrobiota bacterium]|nr:hypothetical protein [Verrucomicrobiota bacterium]
MKSPILITCAVPDELAFFVGRLSGRKQILVGKRKLIQGQLIGVKKTLDIYILFTGMGGEVAGEALIRILQEIQPGTVIISGTAGGLTKGIKTGDLFIAQNYGEEGLRAGFSNRLDLVALPGKVWRETLVTVETVTSGRDAKTMLHEKTGAGAVDMESSFLARITGERGIPSIVIRVISDGLNDQMPVPFGEFMRADGFLSLPRLIVYVLIRPWKIPALVVFGCRVRRACDQLGVALEKLLLYEA